MESWKTDYNKLSPDYNLRYDVNPLYGIEEAIKKFISGRKPDTVLEVGCGTARWLSNIGNKNILKIGVDNSPGMLKKAGESGTGSELVCADANSLPFSGNHFDLIYCVNTLHHFRDQKEFISAAADLLNQNGTLAIFGVDPHNRNDEWYVYDFFEDVREKDLIRFHSSEEIIALMQEFGFKELQRSVAESVVKEWTGSEVFNDSFLRKDQSSQLAALSAEEYKLGIGRITKAIEINPWTQFRVRLTFNYISGIKL